MAMSDMFVQMEGIVAQQLKEIMTQAKKKQSSDLKNGIFDNEGINLAEQLINNNEDLIKDVGTEEFISKNIRVRPESSTEQLDTAE